MIALISLVLASALGLSSLAAQAATVVGLLSTNAAPFDFSTNQGGIRFFNVAFLGPLGQSLSLASPSQNLMVDAYISTFDSFASITARLVSGIGTGGTVLASDTVSASLTRTVAALASLDVSAAGLLSGVYTIVFSGTGTLGGGRVNAPSSNVYVGVKTGTTACGPTGLFNFQSARDFGIRATADPVSAEPVPAAGLLIGGL